MHAMLLSSARPADERPLAAVEVATPEPAAGELRVRVTACAVCRTDLQLCEGDLEAHRLPIIPGHQVVGLVDAIGPGVAGWSVGERAAITWLASACGTCRWCRQGRENLCEAGRFTGWDRDGGYADAIVVRSDFAFRLPTGLDDLRAAPLLCGGVIGYRALKVSGIHPRQRLGLFGFGASALLALQVALHWECRVFVCTRSEREIQRALALGAEWAGTYDAAIPTRLDAAITFAPVGSVVIHALKALDRGGTVAINAIHLDAIPTFSYADLWLERCIRSVANVTRDDARELLDLAERIPIETQLTSYALADANRALADLVHGRVEGAAVLAVNS
jgi:alcohol dehydrogenase, propanol-preferring